MGIEFTPLTKYIEASFKLIGQEPEGLTALKVNSFLLSEDDPEEAVLNPCAFVGIYPVEQGKHLLLAYRVDPNLSFEPYRKKVRSLEVPQRIRTGPLEEVEVNVEEVTQTLTDSRMPSRLLVMGGEDVTVLYCVRGVHPDVALAQIKRGLDYAKVSDN